MENFNIMSMLNNPNKLAQMFMNYQFQGNPLFSRAKQMTEGKSENEIQQIAINLCKERGIDFDSAFNQFKNSFGV